jgi:hydrogenase nickel incorporation protein HypA/HybF
MHELAAASGIVEIMRQHVPLSQAALVRAVRLRVGEDAGLVPASLEFCFDALVAGTPYEKASLEIDRLAGQELRVIDIEIEDGLEVAP